MNARLKNTYDKEIVAKLMSKLKFKNKHQVPRLTKIIINMGLGADATDGKKIKSCTEDMSLIAGQKAIVTKFKKSISTKSHFLSKSTLLGSTKRFKKVQKGPAASKPIFSEGVG